MSDAVPGLQELLAQLVAIDSTSSRSNAPVLDLLQPRLERAGWRCFRQRYLGEGGTPKENLIAPSAQEGPAELALVGHTDCVPFDPSWEGALRLTRKDGKLVGRGACDTKAFVACAVLAAERVGHSRLQRPLALVFTADEEIGCVGAKRLAQEGLLRCRRAIIGEPTSLRPIRAHKGYCLAELTVRGQEGHSAYPDSGRSAIFGAARLLTRIEAFAASELRQQTDASFDPPYTTLNVGQISGGKAKNIIPGSCRFTVEWRPLPGQPTAWVAERLEALVAQLAAEEPGLEAQLDVLRLDPGVQTAADGELVRFLETQTQKTAGSVAFGTEAPQLTALGAEAVVLGPGDIRVAHQTGEYVPLDELVRCEAILEEAIERFCCA